MRSFISEIREKTFIFTEAVFSSTSHRTSRCWRLHSRSCFAFYQFSPKSIRISNQKFIWVKLAENSIEISWTDSNCPLAVNNAVKMETPGWSAITTAFWISRTTTNLDQFIFIVDRQSNAIANRVSSRQSPSSHVQSHRLLPAFFSSFQHISNSHDINSYKNKNKIISPAFCATICTL